MTLGQLFCVACGGASGRAAPVLWESTGLSCLYLVNVRIGKALQAIRVVSGLFPQRLQGALQLKGISALTFGLLLASGVEAKGISLSFCSIICAVAGYTTYSNGVVAFSGVVLIAQRNRLIIMFTNTWN